MAHVSPALITFFVLTALLALALLTWATRSKTVFIVSALWMLLQSVIALTGFYTSTSSLPPRFALALGPPLLVVIAILFAGRRFIAAIDLQRLVFFHTIRIFVELTLYCLFLAKLVPRLMTFEGGNLDILIGLSAPVVWFALRRGILSRLGLLLWNTVGLLGVLNAVVRALLSAPFRFQHSAFDQPTVAVLYFPFILLPAFIVPAAIFCHLATSLKASELAPSKPT